MFDSVIISYLVEKDPDTQVLRHPLPADRKEKAAAYFLNALKDENGNIHEFEFDFIPEPTWDELCSKLPHNCTTCEWAQLKGTHYCPNPTDADPCCDWELHPDAMGQAQFTYYAALHEEHYGSTCLPL